MKKDIHPAYHKKVKVSCACGHSFETGSTLPEIKTEVCSACHPFFTGKQKLLDTARRVERFHTKLAAGKEAAKARKGKKVKRAARATVKAGKKEAKKGK